MDDQNKMTVIGIFFHSNVSVSVNAIVKQLQTHFKENHEKYVGTPFPCVPAPLHPCMYEIVFNKSACNN